MGPPLLLRCVTVLIHPCLTPTHPRTGTCAGNHQHLMPQQITTLNILPVGICVKQHTCCCEECSNIVFTIHTLSCETSQQRLCLWDATQENPGPTANRR